MVQRAAIICIIGLVLKVSVSAEPPLEGRVRLASGEPAVGAQVLLFDLADLRGAPVAATTDGSGRFTLPLTALSGALPERFELGANYPNPFNPSTMIPYQLPTAMYLQLVVFNILGQRVATLVDGEQPAGFHTASWDATDAAGEAVAAGVYLYRLSGAGVQLTRSMLLIDGQAGVTRAGPAGAAPLEDEAGEMAPVYGLAVSGPGLVPYVDPAFWVEAGMPPLDLVVEAPGSLPTAKASSSGGILGDVDNTGRVDFFDALLVALFSRDASIVMPNNGDISLGDVDADGQVDLTDAWLIAVWLNDPSAPALPSGIGEPVGPAASLSPDPSTVTFADDGTWHRFRVAAGEPVTVVANPGTTPRLEITTRSGRGNYCPAEADDDVSRRDGQAVYLAGCAAGPATVELRRPSDGTVLNTYTFEVTGSPADLVVESVSVNDSTLTPGQSFTLRATVRNQGTGQSGATTLRYYRSTNRTISTRDTLIGTDPLGALGASRTSAESIRLTAPSSAGTYYYGACVVSAAGESAGNNCSAVLTVTVSTGAPPVSGPTKLYWTGWKKIQRSNLDGSGVEDLVTTGLDDPIGIALDVSGGKMYWTDLGTDKIQRSNLDGSGVEDLVTTGDDPIGIALDVSGGKMYWTDLGTDKIQRSNLDGSNVEDLVTTGLWHPAGIALDVSGGKMYWTDQRTDKIQRSDLDGSGVEDLVTTGLEFPAGIALDVSGGKMYWTQTGGPGDGEIWRSNLDGSGVEDLVTTGLKGPYGIALDVSGGKMYWTDVSTNKIQRSDLDGSGVEDVVTRLPGLTGIALGFGVPVEAGTDLVVRTSVSDNTLTPRQSFTLRATVRNNWTEQAGPTTLRYYRSSNATISTDDTEVGTDAVSTLSAGATSDESIGLNAPSDAGTYYYGACVDNVSNESNTDNNCSAGVRVRVEAASPDLVVRSASVSDSTLTPGQSFT